MDLGLVIGCDANGNYKNNLAETFRSNQVSDGSMGNILIIHVTK